MAIVKRTAGADQRPVSGNRNMNDIIKLTMWFIKEMGGTEKAKLAINAIGDLEMKLGLAAQEASE